MRFAVVSRLPALVLAGLLAGCNAQTTSSSSSGRHLRPLSYATVAELKAKGFTKDDPILVRLYKQDSEFEVWKQSKVDGKFKHFKTYQICKWSGALGPKIKIGDKQAPEGFYTITPAQMNPNSSYFLSFNTGFPNAFDRAHGRTGEHLMVHGDCLSAGCYAMTDEQMAEIYALARDAFAAGQKSFQVQAMPFRMTAENLAKHRSDPNMAFWKNLKEGNDHFEVTRAEPKVAVCGRRYVFNAEDDAGFSPTAACPDFSVPEAVATAVAAKQQKDEQDTQVMVAKLEAGETARTMLASASPSNWLAAFTSSRPAEPRAAQPQAPALSASEPVAARPDKVDLVASAPAATASRGAQAKPRAPAGSAPAGFSIGGFLSGLVGRSEPAPAAKTPAAPAVAPASAPAPQSRPKATQKQALRDVLPPTLSGSQAILPGHLTAFRN